MIHTARMAVVLAVRTCQRAIDSVFGSVRGWRRQYHGVRSRVLDERVGQHFPLRRAVESELAEEIRLAASLGVVESQQVFGNLRLLNACPIDVGKLHCKGRDMQIFNP